MRNRIEISLSERLENEPSAGGRAIARWMHWRNTIHMDGDFLILFHNLKLRMVNDDLSTSLLRAAEEDEVMAHRDHFLNVGHVEPATCQRLAEDPA